MNSILLNILYSRENTDIALESLESLSQDIKKSGSMSLASLTDAINVMTSNIIAIKLDQPNERIPQLRSLSCSTLDHTDTELSQQLTKLQSICTDLQFLGKCMSLKDSSIWRDLSLKCSTAFQSHDHFTFLQNKPFFIELKSEFFKNLTDLTQALSSPPVKKPLLTKIYNKVMESWINLTFSLFIVLAGIGILAILIFPANKLGQKIYSFACTGMFVTGSIRMFYTGNFSSAFDLYGNWLRVWPALSKTLFYVMIPSLMLMALNACFKKPKERKA
jgi:hypothetical protein